MSQYSVPLKKIVEDLGITIVRKSSDFDTKLIVSASVDRPALKLAGVYNYFDADRMQVIGRVETAFLETLTPDQRRRSFDKFMSIGFPALVVCHDCLPLPECLEMAEKYDRTVLVSQDDTAAFMADLFDTLIEYLAPRITIHGVLVEDGVSLSLTLISGSGEDSAVAICSEVDASLAGVCAVSCFTSSSVIRASDLLTLPVVP